MPYDDNRPVRRNRGSITADIDYLGGVLLMLTVLCAFVPLNPFLPVAGLDPSWAHGMNQATAQGLVFGRDLIFTFGPYASIYTRMYHPATDLMMVGGSLYLAISYAFTCHALAKGQLRRWILAFCMVLAVLLQSRDALLFSVPLVIGLYVYKSIAERQEKMQWPRYAPVQVALLFAPLGLLPLIKASLLILCISTCVLSAGLYYAHRLRLLCAVSLVAPLVSMLFFWLAAGQPLESLPGFFLAMRDIVSGYTEAMAVPGNGKEIAIYGAASAAVLATILAQKNLLMISRLYLFAVYFIFLFLAFKAGFVRHDEHAVAAGVSILIAALFLPTLFQSSLMLPVLTAACISWGYIDSYHGNTSTASIVANFKTTYVSSWLGLKDRAAGSHLLHQRYDNAIQALRQQATFPALRGTTDIYSYDQAHLIASDNKWSPRPILQSYSVYTPALAELNRAYLTGSRAPDNIIFKIQPIDERVPSSEDGSSWPVMLTEYHPTRLYQNALLLEKNARRSQASVHAVELSEPHALGETVTLPVSATPLYARIDIQPTLLGRIANVLIKTSPLHVDMTLANGTHRTFRIVSGMARAGFLISPLVENVVDFNNLYGSPALWNSKNVKSIKVTAFGLAKLWQPNYVISYSGVEPVTSGEQAHLVAENVDARADKDAGHTSPSLSAAAMGRRAGR